MILHEFLPDIFMSFHELFTRIRPILSSRTLLIPNTISWLESLLAPILFASFSILYDNYRDSFRWGWLEETDLRPSIDINGL